MTPAIARGVVDHYPVCVSPDPTFTVAAQGAVLTSYTGFSNRVVLATNVACVDVEALDSEAMHPDERAMFRAALDEPGRLTLDELRKSLDPG